MSYFPIDTANFYIAQIEIASTIAGAAAAGELNLGSIILDTGGLISISGTNILLPDGYDVFAFATLSMSAYTGTSTNDRIAYFTINGASVSNIDFWIGHALQSYDEYSLSSDCAILSKKGGTLSRQLALKDASTSTGFTVAYNSGTSTIPNSCITILYGVL